MDNRLKHKQIESMAALWAKPGSPHAYDVEFDSDNSLPSGWSENFTPDAGAIDPYASFNSGSPRRSINGWRTSCYAIQVPRDVTTYRMSRAITVPTNLFIWYRASYSLTYGDSTGNNGCVALALGATNGADLDANNYIRLFLRESDESNPTQIQVEKIEGASASTVVTTGNRGSTGTGQMYEYAGIQKIGTSLYFWAFSNDGQMFYLGSTTSSISFDRVGLEFYNADNNDIITVDFIRFKESATFLPGYGN